MEDISTKCAARKLLQIAEGHFSGVSFSVTTPNRSGEYLGRVLYMDEGNRLRVISLTILGSISQLIVTIFFCIAAFNDNKARH